jgi:hypothetical protein
LEQLAISPSIISMLAHVPVLELPLLIPSVVVEVAVLDLAVQVDAVDEIVTTSYDKYYKKSGSPHGG